MPLYEYQCGDCGQRTEAIQKVSDPLLTECPHCGGGLHKLLSAPAIRFKGEGWYVTDYASKSSKESKEKEGKAEASGQSESKDKPEAKKEKKSDTKKAASESSS